MTIKSAKKREEIVEQVDNIIKECNDKKMTGRVILTLNFSEGNVASCKKTLEHNSLEE